MRRRLPVFALFSAIFWHLAISIETNAAAPRQISVRRTKEGVRYGLIGKIAEKPSPTLVVLAHGIEEMEKQPIYTEVSALLAPQGWISLIIEPPCHGEDARPDEPPQLDGWRHRLEQDEPFIDRFTAKCRTIVDELVADHIADPDRLAVCGTSRGGFLAYHLAASDKRYKAAAGISPVTALMALREFHTTKQREQVESLDARHLAPKLAGRAVWLSIGNRDLRVNTDDAISFTRAVVKHSARDDQLNAVIPVELIVAPAAGHSKIDQAHELLAAWLSKQVIPGEKPATGGR